MCLKGMKNEAKGEGRWLQKDVEDEDSSGKSVDGYEVGHWL